MKLSKSKGASQSMSRSPSILIDEDTLVGSHEGRGGGAICWRSRASARLKSFWGPKDR